MIRLTYSSFLILIFDNLSFLVLDWLMWGICLFFLFLDFWILFILFGFFIFKISIRVYLIS